MKKGRERERWGERRRERRGMKEREREKMRKERLLLGHLVKYFINKATVYSCAYISEKTRG